MSLIVLYFLHITSVLSFYLDVVLTLSTENYQYADFSLVALDVVHLQRRHWRESWHHDKAQVSPHICHQNHIRVHWIHNFTFDINVEKQISFKPKDNYISVWSTIFTMDRLGLVLIAWINFNTALVIKFLGKGGRNYLFILKLQEWMNNFIQCFIMDVIFIIHAGVKVNPC